MALVLATATFVAAACGDDDGDSAANTSAAPATSVAAPAAPTTAAAPATSAAEGGDDIAAVCALAEEVEAAESFPTHDQLTRYVAIAPAEISAAVGVAAPALLAVPEGDVLNFFKAAARDDVQQAVEQINAWEAANCGIAHDEDALPPGASHDVDAGATRVDVRAEDYTLTMPATLAPGRTSFVLTNHGAEVHHLVIFQLAEGVTFEQAMSAEDAEGMVTGQWSTGLAFPDGEDEEAITFDVTPGNYGVACFIADADGNAHAFGHGMTAEFSVS
jgi:hypothetical protein